MDVMIILPNQLFYDPSAIDQILLHDEIYLIECPKLHNLWKNTLSTHAWSLTVKAAKLYYKWFNKVAIKRDKRPNGRRMAYIGAKKAKGEDFIDHFADLNKQMNIWRPNVDYGPKLANARFNGLPINIYDPPNFLMPNNEAKTYEELAEMMRKKYKLPKNIPKWEYSSISGHTWSLSAASVHRWSLSAPICPDEAHEALMAALECKTKALSNELLACLIWALDIGLLGPDMALEWATRTKIGTRRAKEAILGLLIWREWQKK
jgi:hypothetical protein